MRRNRLLLLLLFLLSLTYVYFYGGKIPYMLFYTVLILPVVSILYTLLVIYLFKYRQEVDKKLVIKGDSVNFLFSINNEGLILFPYIKVVFCGADTIFKDQFQTKSFSIPPFGKKSYSFELNCKYRGYYQIGIHSIEMEDFLGIFRIKYKIPEPKYITVYPKVECLDFFPLHSDFSSDTHTTLQNSFEDQSSIDDTRKYAYGDPLKKIHWKLTAKSGELMIKKYQSTSETSAVIFIDLFANTYTFEQNTIIEDKVIEAAVAVLEFCLRNWIPIKLVYYESGVREIEANNPLMFGELYNLLAKIRFNEKIELKDLLDIYLKDSINKTNIILFTSSISYDLYNEIYNAKISGFDVNFVYISPQEVISQKNSEEDNIISFLPEIGVTANRLDISSDIKLLKVRA